MVNQETAAIQPQKMEKTLTSVQQSKPSNMRLGSHYTPPSTLIYLQVICI